MLKILQARLQQYVNRELLDVQAGFSKGRGSRDQIANIHWLIKKAKVFQTNAYFCFMPKFSTFCFVKLAIAILGLEQFSCYYLNSIIPLTYNKLNLN